MPNALPVARTIPPTADETIADAAAGHEGPTDEIPGVAGTASVVRVRAAFRDPALLTRRPPPESAVDDVTTVERVVARERAAHVTIADVNAFAAEIAPPTACASTDSDPEGTVSRPEGRRRRAFADFDFRLDADSPETSGAAVSAPARGDGVRFGFADDAPALEGVDLRPPPEPPVFFFADFGDTDFRRRFDADSAERLPRREEDGRLRDFSFRLPPALRSLEE